MSDQRWRSLPSSSELYAATLLLLARVVNRMRLRVGGWVLGNGWFGVVGRLWLIRERAMIAIHQDGRVVLADCQALADALYGPVPGRWKLTIERLEEPVSPPSDPQPSETAAASPQKNGGET